MGSGVNQLEFDQFWRDTVNVFPATKHHFGREREKNVTGGRRPYSPALWKREKRDGWKASIQPSALKEREREREREREKRDGWKASIQPSALPLRGQTAGPK